jgi:hypothetical protein
MRNSFFLGLASALIAVPAAASIAKLGDVVGTVITFVGWEDRIGGDFDYNDLIFGFTDSPFAFAGAVASGTGKLGFSRCWAVWRCLAAAPFRNPAIRCPLTSDRRALR